MRKEFDSHRVVAVATPGVPVFELAVAIEVFGTDRSELSPSWYSFQLVTAGGDTTIGAGLMAPQGHGLAALEDADTVVIPACASIHAGSPPALLPALRDAHARGARIVAFCSGAFVLAEANLLSGRRATTHWMHAEELARRHPDVQVDPQVLYVHDSGIWTSAGSAAALDLCLELVRQDHGATVANEVARRIVVPPHRDGGQAQYIRPHRTQATTSEAELHDWVASHLENVTVADMARRMGVSTRTLNRRFRDRTNTTPQEWLQRERLTAAQDLLAATDLPVEAVAARVGFGTAANLRAHFARLLHTNPAAYRRAFRGTGAGRIRELPSARAERRESA